MNEHGRKEHVLAVADLECRQALRIDATHDLLRRIEKAQFMPGRMLPDAGTFLVDRDFQICVRDLVRVGNVFERGILVHAADREPHIDAMRNFVR